MTIIEEITADFIETFPNKEECTGAMAQIITTGYLPEGVDPESPKVKQIIQWCRENYPQPGY